MAEHPHAGLVPALDGRGDTGSTFTPDLARLALPFGRQDLEWKVQQSGVAGNSKKPWALIVCYLSARAIMDRLDQVCGPDGWRNAYLEAPTQVDGMMAGIGVRVRGEWLWKWDGSGAVGEENLGSENAVKGTFSNALKRAAVLWGIGRYLYGFPSMFADIYQGEGRPPNDQGWERGRMKDKTEFWWRAPREVEGLYADAPSLAPEPKQESTPTEPTRQAVEVDLQQARAMGYPFGTHKGEAIGSRRADGEYLFSINSLNRALDWCRTKYNETSSESERAKFHLWARCITMEYNERKREASLIEGGSEVSGGYA